MFLNEDYERKLRFPNICLKPDVFADIPTSTFTRNGSLLTKIDIDSFQSYLNPSNSEYDDRIKALKELLKKDIIFRNNLLNCQVILRRELIRRVLMKRAIPSMNKLLKGSQGLKFADEKGFAIVDRKLVKQHWFSFEYEYSLIGNDNRDKLDSYGIRMEMEIGSIRKENEAIRKILPNLSCEITNFERNFEGFKKAVEEKRMLMEKLISEEKTIKR